MTTESRPGIVEALELAVDALEAEGVEYAITGSFTLAYYGYPRATAGVDLKIQATNLEQRLEHVRKRLLARFRIEDETTFVFADTYAVELYPANNPLDVEAMDRRVRARILHGTEREFWIVTIEDLLLIKIREHLKHTWDAKHVTDARALIIANRDRIDFDDLESRLRKHNLYEAWLKYVEPKTTG